MKHYVSHILILLLVILMFSACTKPVYIQPPRVVKEISTLKNDVAPVQRSQLKGKENCDQCQKEFSQLSQVDFDGILPSERKLSNIISSEAIEKLGLENAFFLTDNSGFVVIPHPPDPNYAKKIGVDISGNVGGSDIFEFYEENGKYEFVNLGSQINSIFWDSHPTAVFDEKCNILLVFASDRKRPYSKLNPLEGSEKEYKGETDLYYVFKIGGKWGRVKSFLDVSGNISVGNYNDETPFIYCMCNKPYLIFSSNRGGDYDLYYAQLEIDFEKEEIKVAQEATAFPKVTDVHPYDAINTPFAEKFPYVPNPIVADGSQNKLYFVSNRYYENYKYREDTIIKNVGGYDVYSYPLNLNCIPPKVNLYVTIVNAENPKEDVDEPIVSVVAKGSSEKPKVKKGENPAKFELDFGKKYEVRGGSTLDRIKCVEGKDSVTAFYMQRIISQREPRIIKVEQREKYYELVPRQAVIRVDTIKSTLKISAGDLSRLSLSANKKIQSVTVDGDSLVVKLIEIIEERGIVKIDTVFKERKFVKDSIVTGFDTTYIELNENYLSYSTKTGYDKYITVNKQKHDVNIYDTIYVWPKYYRFPPCEYKYIKHTEDYRRNVPYYQTCFWEVNTVKNLEKHISELKSRKYANASFIELHPENSYFGYRRFQNDPKREEKRKARYENRVYIYREFAREVDRNIKQMVNEITGDILPAFKELEELSGQNDNKLVIIVNAYSDKRPIERGYFVSDTAVTFFSVSYDTLKNAVNSVEKVTINPNQSLAGADNNVLSDLRVYFGFLEIFQRLKNNELFKFYLDNNLVLLPFGHNSVEEFKKKMEKAKILFFIEGKRLAPSSNMLIGYDPLVEHIIEGYQRKPGDYYTYDPVRRINVLIRRIVYMNGRFEAPKCCTPTPRPKAELEKKE